MSRYCLCIVPEDVPLYILPTYQDYVLLSLKIKHVSQLLKRKIWQMCKSP